MRTLAMSSSDTVVTMQQPRALASLAASMCLHWGQKAGAPFGAPVVREGCFRGGANGRYLLSLPADCLLAEGRSRQSSRQQTQRTKRGKAFSTGFMHS